MKNKICIGERIIKYRKERGLTQGEFGELLGVSAQAISKWENDQSKPDTENLIRLAAILEVDVNDLIGNQLPEKESEPQQTHGKHYRFVIPVISVLLILSICLNILLWVLLGVSNGTRNDTGNISTEPVSATRWDSVTLEVSTLLETKVIPLTEEDKKSLSDHIWNAKYVKASDEVVNQILYGGSRVTVTFVRGETEHIWAYRDSYYIHYQIKQNGKVWHSYYESSEAERNWIQSYIK